MTQCKGGQHGNSSLIGHCKIIFRVTYFCGSTSYLGSPKSSNVVKESKKSQNFVNHSNTAVTCNYEWRSRRFKTSRHVRSKLDATVHGPVQYQM